MSYSVIQEPASDFGSHISLSFPCNASSLPVISLPHLDICKCKRLANVLHVEQLMNLMSDFTAGK
eukprot:CAMPEP_0185904376 /NCGR_PEP_ID=MMETSP0196C-20130402/3688_1 /TAXON_ID=2932 /ORGANISM="Alexandrium fundyense, Strain CCMP1719" /LENGTH=64 /DNA_ID=CAMNT_0028623673 /DNA_START=44 /DNA_END=235 /DNA_ORIENTATION=-